ncbi:MAG: hypothetical protein CVT66_11205 [Actinobacteria bacterium HGW-Actinobacteria-6]|jgi:5'-nucleotidase|nr:MAG: hypothetical protein CVT66_11205 [Actinobacteria bacterium HGW-Actinobacteria-6]
MGTKKFTILHSNDMHGDFLVEMDGAGEQNVIYCIVGDMVQGSIIDSEFKGESRQVRGRLTYR